MAGTGRHGSGLRAIRTGGSATMLAALVVAGMLVSTQAMAVQAECAQAARWPSFTKSAGAAETILIGTVVWTPGGAVNNRFTLRVDQVLRGTAPATIEFKAFRSGAPQPICPEDSVLRVRDVGERLALAYGAVLPGSKREITAVAFVEPSRPDRGLLPGMERLSEAEIREIAGVSEPDVGVPLTSTLTKEDALARVRELYGEDTLGATEVEAYLESATLESSLGTLDPIEDRPVWNVHLSGMGIVRTGPITDDGPAVSVVIDNVYVFLDADTGEFLVSIWTE